MNKHFQRVLAFLLVLVFSFQIGDVALAAGAEELRAALDPTSAIELSVPEDLSEGNWFFIRERRFSISETSEDRLYIPIQRAGDLSEAASVTLKLVDVSSHYGVNYQAEIFRVEQEALAEYGEFSLVDAIHENQDTLEEVPELSEEELEEALSQQGETEITGAAGNVIGTISAEGAEVEHELDEDAESTPHQSAAPTASPEGEAQETEDAPTASPQGEAQETEDAPTASPEGEAQETEDAPTASPQGEAQDGDSGADAAEDTDAAPAADAVLAALDSGLALVSEQLAPAAVGEPEAEEAAPVKNPLQAARDAFTGTVSDRQPLESDTSWMSPGLQALYDTGDDSLAETEAEADYEDEYLTPGYTFTLDYAPGEDVKFLVVTPLYSARADGDSTLMLTLEEPVGGFLLHEDFFTTYVMIEDEDEPETVLVGFSQPVYTAEEGKVTLTVTREGALNDIVTVTVSTYGGSAVQGADYSGMNAKLYFPMGLERRTVEIPVGHGAKELDFYVALTPVSDCEVALDTARVVIPAAEPGAELLLEDRYLDEPFTDVYSNNGATVDGTGGSFTTPDKIYERIGLTIQNGWGNESYFYDGVRITWSAKIRNLFQGRVYFAAQTLLPSIWYSRDVPYQDMIVDIDSETAEFFYNAANLFKGNGFEDQDLDYYFGRGENPYQYEILAFCSNSTFFSPSATVSVEALTPIKREFTFEVLPAEPLGLRGVPADDEKQLNGVYVNSSLTDASVTVLSGGMFALTAQTVSEYSRFVGVDAVAPDGSTIRIANSISGTRTLNVEVTESMISTLGRLGYIEFVKNPRIDQSSLRGVIQIRPVFEKIPATVRIEEGAYGSFEGFEGGGEYEYFLGERITLKTVLNERGVAAGVRGSGIGYFKADGKEGVRLDQSNDSPYLNTEMTKVFVIDQPYTNIWPVFDTNGNAVTVQISGTDLQYFDTTRGLFTMDDDPNYNPDTDMYTYYVADNATVNQVMLLTAVTKDNTVPLWKDARSDEWYSGTLFPIRVGTSQAENVIRLSAYLDQYRRFGVFTSGTLAAQEINLATGRPSGQLGTAQDAVVYFGTGSAVTGPDGSFTMASETRVASGTPVRYAVSYNGALTIRETRAPVFELDTLILTAMEDPDTDWDSWWYQYIDPETFEAKPLSMDLGLVQVPSFSTLGAHITDVYAIQDHHYMTDAKILEMNGQETVLAARVSPGEGYVLNGELRQENALSVVFYFENPQTNELHGEFEAAYDEETDTWRVDLGAFTPNRLSDFSYGDVLYAQLTTDKQLSAVYDAESEESLVMCYDPVSTGYAVISDSDYKPTIFDYDMPVDAESMFGPDGVIARGGGDPELWDAPYDEALLQDSVTRTTYGEFPFIGELNCIIKVLTYVGGASKRAEKMVTQMLLHDDDDDFDDDGMMSEGLMGDDGELMNYFEGKQTRISIAMKFASLPYGATRFAFALVFTQGNKNWDNYMADPYVDTGAAARRITSSTLSEDKVINASKEYTNKRSNRNGFFGPNLFSLSFTIGFYLDFGYLNITEIDETGHSTTTHDCVYLGGGGLGGYIGSLSTVTPLPTPFPAYGGFEVDASIIFNLGSSKNPKLALNAFRSQTELDGIDYDFTYNITGQVDLKGVLGVGFDHALGLRGNLGAKVELWYSPKFEQWFPTNQYFHNRPFSWGSSLVMSGYLDAVFVNIPLATFTVPITYYGYLHLFNQMRIGSRVVKYVQEGVNDLLESGKGDPGVISNCTDKCKRILDAISRFTSPKQLTDQLREYAYKNGVINAFEYKNSFAAEIGGIAGMIGRLLDDGGEAEAPTWSVQPHTASQWVAGDSAELMAAYSPVASTTLVEDSREQTNARLLDIGGDRLLLVFLGDDPARSETQASILQYAVYNTGSGVWEVLPTVVQDDGTGDYMPDLCDAGEDVILSWISTAPDKVPQEGEDPTEDMDNMDVFTVRLRKSDLSAPEGIVQLTDDAVYDTQPRAVYDSESGDVLVIYTKTMPDTDYEPASITQKVLDYTTGGAQMYSINAYMLYDAARGDWARDYFYPEESAFDDPAEEADFLAAWGGQRFVRVSIEDQSDPAIRELTVSRGYNGLAAYAYTVDKDYDLSTYGDRELYVQFYDFRSHSTYVPIRMTDDDVSQTMPVLTRSNGDTYLFWLEDSSALKYVNVSRMLRDYALDEDEVKYYAVRSDGTFAEGYEPPVNTVDMSSLTNDEDLKGLTGYTVLTNESTLDNGERYDDLYVIWTSGETYEVELPESGLGETRTETCKEIYAAAFIHEQDRGDSEEGLAEASWSEPYRLTEDHKYHDGVAAAIDSKGDLYLVHNQFDMIWHGDDEDWIASHFSEGVDDNGQTYYEGDCYEYTQTDLVMTRCVPVGSLEITQVVLSDETPMPGETVQASAVLANTGLTTARGYELNIYETKNGVRGERLKSLTSESRIVPNDGRTVSFNWSLPSDLEGVGLECVVSERDPKHDSYYEPRVTAHSPIKLTRELSGEVLSVTQKGEVFEAEIAVTNSGNIPAEDGANAKLYLECLYGNAKEVYGVDDTTLSTVDLSGLAPGETLRQTLTLSIPVSVFDVCGFDAVRLYTFSAENDMLHKTDQFFVCLDAPMALSMDNVKLKLGQSAPLELRYSISPTRDENSSVIYTVADPSVAVVMNGELMSVSAGETTLTATILPYGNTVTVPVVVTSAGQAYPVNPGTPDTPEETPAPKQVFADVAENAWYAEAVAWAVEQGIAAGTDATHFSPAVPCTRAQLVTFLWRAAGCPEPEETGTPFTDVAEGSYYAKAVAWAAETGVAKGVSETQFAPNRTVTRAQTVTFLYRYAKAEVEAVKVFEDVEPEAWYAGAVAWACEQGVTKGVDETHFAPGNDCTRAQIVTFLYRLLKR